MVKSFTLSIVKYFTLDTKFRQHLYATGCWGIATWILGVASKQLRLLHGRVRDSTTLVNSLSPQMSELVEDAIASWCDDIVEHFWLIRNELQKLVELKFEFFSFNTFDVSQIFWQRLYNRGPNTVIAFSWRDCAGFLFVGYWITHYVPSLGCFLVFIVCPIVPSIFDTICWLCYLPNKYNYVTFRASLARVQFEFVQSFPVV